MSGEDPNNRTKIIQPGAMSEERRAGKTPVLVVVQGEEIGRRYLLNAQRMTLGRDGGSADLAIADPSVSGAHAVLKLDGSEPRYEILDLGSSNGTYVNGIRVVSRILQDSDKIFLGNTILKFTFHDSIEANFYRQIDQLMHIDSLTGLYVRRWFDQEYPKAFARAETDQRPFSVLMMDMDGLKQINDSHGHQMGSHCISEAGKLIRQALQPDGVGARFGGDEFVAFLPGTGLDGARAIAEQIRETIDCFDFFLNGIHVEPTISIGVAEREPELGDSDALARLADAELYRAKSAGRNCVRP